MTNFISIDFETANEARTSACAVGIALVVDGKLAGGWSSLINPHARFAPINVGIHGISESDVVDAPTFPDVLPRILEAITGPELVVAHSAAFDMRVLAASAAHHGLPLPLIRFGCTRVFARHWWPGWPSYALDYVAGALDLYREIGDHHHDALWDARAAALIGVRGLEKSGATSWAQACEREPVSIGVMDPDHYRGCLTKDVGHIRPIRDPDAEADPAHPLYGLSVCFTGALSLYTRRDAAQAVVDAGGEFSPNVTKRTDLLVVGEQDLAVLAGQDKSSKMRKATEMAAGGHPIEIISEADFYRLLAV